MDASCVPSPQADVHACCMADEDEGVEAEEEALAVTLPPTPGGGSPEPCCGPGSTKGIAEPSRVERDTASDEDTDDALAPLLALERNPVPKPASFRLANRGDTYLRCCVFLI